MDACDSIRTPHGCEALGLTRRMLLRPRWSSPPRSPTCCCCSRSRRIGDARARSGPLDHRQRLGLCAVDGGVLHRLDLLRQRRPRRGAGVWFLPIYLGPTLAMLLAWMVLRKMIRIAETYRITSIADFIASRYGKSPLLAGARDADHRRRHRSLHRPAAQGDRQRLCPADHAARHAARRAARLVARQHASTSRSRWPASRSSSAPATSTAPSATRAWSRRSPSSRSSSCSPSWRSARSSPGASVRRTGRHLRARRAPSPSCASCSASPRAPGQRFAYGQWFALTLLSMLSVVFLPRQFQMMVVENVDERHLRARGLGVPALPAADQPVRAADRARRPAALRPGRHGRRQLRALAAAGRWGSRGWRCSPSSAGCRRPPAWSSSRRSRSRPWSATTW